MKQRNRIAVSSPCALLVLLLASAGSAEEQPQKERRHIFLAHLTTAPIYYGAQVYTGHDPAYEPEKPGGYTPLNIGASADYEYRFGWVHFGVGARYNYAILNSGGANHVHDFKTHEIDIPLLVTMEKNLGGSSIGVTVGLGYYMGFYAAYYGYCDCLLWYGPALIGVHTEALFSYTKEVSEGLDFSVRTGIIAGMNMLDSEDFWRRYSFPIELGLRARW